MKVLASGGLTEGRVVHVEGRVVLTEYTEYSHGEHRVHGG